MRQLKTMTTPEEVNATTQPLRWRSPTTYANGSLEIATDRNGANRTTAMKMNCWISIASIMTNYAWVRLSNKVAVTV